MTTATNIEQRMARAMQLHSAGQLQEGVRRCLGQTPGGSLRIQEADNAFPTLPLWDEGEAETQMEASAAPSDMTDAERAAAAARQQPDDKTSAGGATPSGDKQEEPRVHAVDNN